MSASLVGVVGTLLVAIGSGATVGVILRDRQSWPRQVWAQYEYKLEQGFRSLLMTVDAGRIARLQLVIILVLLALGIATAQPLFLVLAFFAGIAPLAWIESRRRERVTSLEQQLESWLQLVASSLRASGSVGAAIESTASLVPDPLKQEIDLVIKKMALGVPLERALMEMGSRTDSQTVSGALAAIIIGQRTGGDVPALLERAASSLREMARLEGMVRAKTAEGKLQALVLAIAPAAFVAGLRALKPDWFDPLFSQTGYLMMGSAIALWIVAVVVARKILQVED